MCGIAGVLHRDGSPPDQGLLRAMGQVLAHRGPDAEGVWSGPGIGLSHRRLAIVDLSAAAAQPFISDDTRTVLVFNGELYNFKELRAELEARGEKFRSASDTEVLLRGYLVWGTEVVNRIDGMFAFALWDGRTRSLVIARDRTGKKPLYIYEDAARVAFGSEIKALLTLPDVDDSAAPEAVPQFLTHGYVPTPGTFYRRVRKLPPGCFEVFDDQGKSGGPREYWDFPLDAPAEVSADEAGREVRRLCTAAVQRRMVADVPLGAFLSGGVDSSLVVGVMANASSSPVKTFSIGFEGHPEWDETRYAEKVAAHFKTEHTVFRVKPESFDLIEKLAWHYDEPFGDSSAIPTFIVSSLTRSKVTVALTGDGGDEVFAGYDRFIGATLAERVPGLARGVLGAAAGLLPARDARAHPLSRIKRLGQQVSRPLPDRLRRWLTLFPPEELASLLTDDYARHAAEWTLAQSYRAAAARASSGDALNQALYINAKTYLLEDLNVKMDRASMAASLETRSPFLDTALMEYAFRLPGALKLKGRTTKWILKRAFEGFLPPEIFVRKKMGFGVPLGAWFRGELKQALSDRLLQSGAKIHAVIRPEALKRVFDRHHAGLEDYGLQLWALWMLELWLRKARER